MIIDSSNSKTSIFFKIMGKIFYNNILNKIFAYCYVFLRDSYDMTRYRQYRKIYDIDPSFKFSGNNIVLAGNGEINLAENSYIVSNSILEAFEYCKITIGRNTAIGPYVKMYTADKSTDQNLDQNPFSGKIKLSVKDIKIGNGCWIGANVGITGGVKIGDNSIIGMNSVVTRDVPPHCIAVGSPARVVKFKSYLSEREISKILKEYNINL